MGGRLAVCQGRASISQQTNRALSSSTRQAEPQGREQHPVLCELGRHGTCLHSPLRKSCIDALPGTPLVVGPVEAARENGRVPWTEKDLPG